MENSLTQSVAAGDPGTPDPPLMTSKGTSSARGPGMALVPSLPGLRAAADTFAPLAFPLTLGPDRDSESGIGSAKWNDLDQRGSLLEGVYAVGRGRDERKVHRRLVGICVDQAAQHLDHAVGPVYGGKEETAPALGRADRPIVVELHRGVRLVGAAGDLESAMVAHHLPVEFPPRRDGSPLFRDLQPNGRGKWDDPADAQSIEEGHASFHRHAVVHCGHLRLVDSRKATKPCRQDAFGRNRLRDEPFVLRSAQELNDGLSPEHRAAPPQPQPDRSL